MIIIRVLDDLILVKSHYQSREDYDDGKSGRNINAMKR